MTNLRFLEGLENIIPALAA
jgi:U3 small nucleolar RNA-associated protein 20